MIVNMCFLLSPSGLGNSTENWGWYGKSVHSLIELSAEWVYPANFSLNTTTYLSEEESYHSGLK
jgi:hypothetical protein